MKKILLIIVALLLLPFIVYFHQISAVSNNEETVAFDVVKGQSFSSISSNLKEAGLIRSEFFYKIYVRLNKPSQLQAGRYFLSSSYTVSEIISELEKGSNYNPDAVRITVPEGTNLLGIATIVANATNHTAEDLLKVWDSKEFVNKAINKYDFIDNSVLNNKLRHPLEGYFFASTYELLNKDVSPETIAYRFLDQMQVIFNKYEGQITASKYNNHQILTLASIIQFESGKFDDMKTISSVFHNRLNNNKKLESSVTVCYALKDVAHWTECEMNSKIDSPYNTYLYPGLPVGPILNIGEHALVAMLEPDKTDYFFFLADVCPGGTGETHFSKTLAEHNIKKNRYLTCYGGRS